MPSTSRQQTACANPEPARRTRLLPALAALAALLPLAGTHAAWDEKYTNPKPLDGDVILPMPCDGQMVFRKVQIPLAAPLDDYAITLGQDGDDWGYLEQARPEHIAGSFTVGAPEPGRYYLMAKYELTELQYQAVMDSACPQPSNRLRLPKTGVSWFEALAFADRYNLWLRQHAGDRLPKEDGVAGFVRLPTEAEWEFAARGGLAVSPAEFRDLRFPTPDGLTAYAWFAGSQSANGNLQLAGLLQPNPLGLHDMLGNADEMLFESFRLNKLDRPHGQAGGYTVRGGHFLTPEAELRTALRQEQPYYAADGGNTRLRTGGFRLVLVAPVLTSRQRIGEVERDWQALGGTRPADSGQQAGGALDTMAQIAGTVADAALKQQLESLRNDLRANAQARDEQRDQAIRSELQLGAFLCTKLKDDGLFLDMLEGNFERSCGANGSDTDAARCQSRRTQLDSHRQVLAFLLNYYADSVVGSALNYSQETIAPQISVVEQQMQLRSKSNLPAYLRVHWNNLSGYLGNGRVVRNQWLQSCKTI